MSFLDLWWTYFPYVVWASLIIGVIWRWNYDQFGWTSRSSELYEKKWLRLSSPLFHFGILGVGAGHLLGILVPESWTTALGISEHMYHMAAVIFGSLAGLATVIGLVGLLVRRFKYKSVRLATTPGDIVTYTFLTAAIFLGAYATVTQQIFGEPGGYNYRDTISVWFRSVFYLDPQAQLMATAPQSFQLHVLAGMLLFAVWPYTRLVHFFSAPVGYTTRPYTVYRDRATTVGKPQRPRGWAALPDGSEEVLVKPKRTYVGSFDTPRSGE